MTRPALLMCAMLTVSAVWAKGGRTYYTDEMVGHALEKVAGQPWAQAELNSAKASCAWVVEMSDQELWDFVPPPQQARALNVCFGTDCPVHGKEIFRKAGNYPWIMSRDKPFKVTCPVGGESYPSNDFEGWNLEGTAGKPESGPGYVDKGLGWTDAAGKRYWFVAYYTFWQRWQRDIIPSVNALAKAHLLSGDPVYAHKCGVLLSRIAGFYEDFDYRVQAYHNGSWPARINGRILDYIWETGVISNFAKAYDAIYPALGQDSELQAFLSEKGIEQPARHIEQRMLNVMAGDIMRGFIKGNYGMYQQALATLALVLDNEDAQSGPTRKQMVDWILTGPGEVEYMLWNGFYRDGHGGESSPGYSSGWCVNFYQTAELLDRLGVPVWDSPKVKKMADIGLDLVVAGEHTPDIGDSGSILGSKRVGWSAAVQGAAYRQWRDPRHAQALAAIGAKTETLWEESIDEEVARVAAERGTDPGLSTRNLGGYGLAVLEAGEGVRRRGVSMYYGHAGGGHGHLDRLNIEMFSHGRPMLPDMGYPAHWLEKNSYWTSNTTSHYAVLVDQAGQATHYPGHLNTLASAPGVQLMDASAQDVAYPGVTSVYRRTCALVDVSPDDSYLLDIFRVEGGTQHDWSFHGPPFPEFSVTGGEPSARQATGTLAGEKVGFGQAPAGVDVGGGLSVSLKSCQGILDDDRAYADRSLEGWALYNAEQILTRKVGSQFSTKLAQPVQGKVKVSLRVHDYNVGANAVDITLGSVTESFHWEPSGEVGFRWISRVYDLAEPVSEIVVTARAHGQSYILLGNLALSQGEDAGEPKLIDLRRSGFQYLFNVRRMNPEGAWTATWRKPDEDLALTLTVPAGSVREVILADAEPELKPGHPETLQYVMGRNVLPSDAPSDDALRSVYVAVAEPHKGAAKVGAVERLPGESPDPWAVGLLVRREGGYDLIHSALDPNARSVWQTAEGPFEATGEFALVRVTADGVAGASLVNGTSARWAGMCLQAGPSVEARVVSVDLSRNQIVIDAQVPAADAYGGRVLISGNDLHQTSYTIQGATPGEGGTTIDLGDVLCTVGMGNVTACDSAQGTVSTDTQLTGYGRVDGGRHQGRWLYNEDRSAGLRIRSFAGGAFRLDDADRDLDGVFVDVDGDGLRRFWISDLGPGDTVRIPSVTAIERVRENLYDIKMMTEARLVLPVNGG